ncbi:hypothetical protein DFJ74DRAFT_660019 [Hyaloraphidium curvatum]|nr:hypothetical protein DFJ74DRAFT_660019 [Hyaloraphidium curvatum]
MATTELARDTSPHLAGLPAAQEDAPATRVTLPPELLLAVMWLLEGRGHKRTLLNFISVSRSAYSLGIGVLLRRVSVSRISTHAGAGPRALDRFRGLVEDGLGTGKLAQVRELSVEIRKQDPFYSKLLRRAGPSLKELRITASSVGGVEFFLEDVRTARKLKRVSISVDPAKDFENALDPQAEPFLPLLRHLDRLQTLRRISFHDKSSQWMNQVPGSRSWASSFQDFPKLASRLRSVTLFDSNLHEWHAAKFKSVRTIRIHFQEFETAPHNLARIFSAFPGARCLHIHGAKTGPLLQNCIIPALTEFSIHRCELDLPPQSFPDVKVAMEACGAKILVAPNWDWMSDLVADSMDVLEARDVVDSWRNEEAFWAGISGVTIEGFDDWDRVLDDWEESTGENVDEDGSSK